MLAYILALAVGLGSLGLYLAAFFLPEVHRKTDFIWSGIGLFYALMLWVCAGRITGGVLLGQMAGVALLGWFGWQTLTLRRALIPPDQQTELPSTTATAETVKAKALALKDTLQSKLANSSLPEIASQLPEKATGLFNTAKERVQGTLESVKKRGEKPTPKTPQPPVNPKVAEKPATPEVKATPVETVTPPATAPAEVVEPDSEADAIRPVGDPLRGIAQSFPPAEVAVETDSEAEASAPPAEKAETPKASPFETFAKEVEVVPPEETPELDTTVTPPITPPIVTGTEPSESESSQAEETPKLMRPNPPSPELVEEAVEDAEAKHMPASPPPTNKPEDSQES